MISPVYDPAVGMFFPLVTGEAFNRSGYWRLHKKPDFRVAGSARTWRRH